MLAGGASGCASGVAGAWQRFAAGLPQMTGGGGVGLCFGWSWAGLGAEPAAGCRGDEKISAAVLTPESGERISGSSAAMTTVGCWRFAGCFSEGLA